MIQRDFYLNQMKDKMWNGNIKVITGLRRCGKSTLLFDLFKGYLIANGVQEECMIEFELDKRKYLKYRNPITLCDYVEKIVNSNKQNKYYLFIDEVQLSLSVKDDETGIEVTIYDMLNELRGYKNLDCYVTGSNSKMLSSDIATEFRGRSTQIKVYPLSFQEFYSFKGGNVDDAVKEYMLYGGMPGLLNENSDEGKKEYLKNLYNEIYLKDLVEHGKIRREDILEEILDVLASQISSLTNANNIANVINAKSEYKIDSGIVMRYLNQVKDSFLIFEAKRFDIKGHKYFEYPNKYYYTDIGLRNIRLNFRQIDQGHIMENIIYNELTRRGYSVDIGVVEEKSNNQIKQKEIDFVVNYFDKKIYIQSAYKIEDDYKEKSELNSLKLTNDFFKKIIIRDDILVTHYDESGILHLSLVDFLLDKVVLF